MIRALPALIVIVILIAVAIFIADRPGSVELDWQGWRIDTNVAVLALGMGLLGMIAAGLFHFIRKLVTAPASFLRWRRERRREQGFHALTQGMVAVAAGDPEEAMKHSRRADALLAEPPLTLLLSAQAAQLNGDHSAAKKYFSAMLERTETEFLGLRGLLMQALHAGDEIAALKLVERARELRPKTPWVLHRLYHLRARAGQWIAAEATLSEAIARKAVADVTGRHHRAVLLHEQSREAAAAGDPGKATTLAEKSVAADRGFAPAAIHLAQLQSARPRRALRTLLAAWREMPRPELARAFAALFAHETPVQRVKRMETLASANSTHPESNLAVAEAALEAKLWGEARRHLVAAGAGDANPSPRLCRLMAQLEEEEHGDQAAARAWLARAAATPTADPTYVCENCGAELPQWSAHCPQCREFGSLVWRVPKRGAVPAGDVAARLIGPPAAVIDITQPQPNSFLSAPGGGEVR
ncbi:MAG TPA: heme biosynthesis HemY N-terminal domain-containing protein [Stellaceae bacterium]|nr:heme biosynthesis HemY N-terminal domain-containing protein [Stellaceae bacterium]